MIGINSNLDYLYGPMGASGNPTARPLAARPATTPKPMMFGANSMLWPYLMSFGSGMLTAPPGSDFGQSIGRGLASGNQALQTYPLRSLQMEALKERIEASKTKRGQLQKPTIKAFIVGKKKIYKRWNPLTGEWETMQGVGGPRMVPKTTVNVNNRLGFKPLTELGKLQSDYENLRKKFGPDHPATRAAQQKIETYGLSSKTKGEIEKSVVEARAGLERIKGIAGQFDPAYQTVPEMLKNKARSLWEKLGGELTPEQQQQLAKFTTFQRETIQNLNLYIRAITGAQLSEHEAERIMEGMPNLDDSPTEFKAKLESTIRELEAAIARAEGQRKGELAKPGAGGEGKPDLYKKYNLER